MNSWSTKENNVLTYQRYGYELFKLFRNNWYINTNESI